MPRAKDGLPRAPFERRWTFGPTATRECLRLDRSCGSESVLLHRKPRIVPPAEAAVHRDDVGVAHLSKVVRSERGPKAPAAVKDDVGGRVGDLRLDVAL